VIGRQEDALSEQIDADPTGLVLQQTERAPDDVEDGVPF
jgi:hypothetical protein